MLTLDETLTAQSDLELLCSDRRLQTAEIFAPNAFYGIDQVLKQYTNLPRGYSLKAVVPHGLVLQPGYLWDVERCATLPAILSYPPYRRNSYLQLTDKRVVQSAAPFAYVVEMLRGTSCQERAGTIFFPTHSTHHLTVQADFDRCARRLAQLSPEYQPITVCIYWKDFHLGHHRPFAQRGMRIVSAGHMFDPAFLYRFYHLCSIHKYAASNGVGSHMFYAAKSGCSYFHLEAGDISYTAAEDTRARELAECPPEWLAELKKLFCDPIPVISKEQRETVDYYLGITYLKSGVELRRQLYSFEVLDKIRLPLSRNAGRTSVTAPTFYQRQAKRVRTRIERGRAALLRSRAPRDGGVE